MKHWWRVLPGVAFIFLMGVGLTIVFDKTCYGVVFGNYRTLQYYDCLPAAEGNHLPAPLAGWLLIAAGIGMLYLSLFPFIHDLFRWTTQEESRMTETPTSDTTQSKTTTPMARYRRSSNRWKMIAVAAIAALLGVLITLVITGTNRGTVSIDEAAQYSDTSDTSGPALSGPDWLVWEDAGVQYMTLEAAQRQGADSFFVDVGCYSDAAMMIWVGWITDVAYWGTDQQVRASLRIGEPGGSTTELFGEILPATSAAPEGYIHYFSVTENDDASELAETLATSSELRLEIFADWAFWGPDEGSFPRDSEFAVHTSGVVHPGLFDTYLPQLTRCPYQDFFGVG